VATAFWAVGVIVPGACNSDEPVDTQGRETVGSQSGPPGSETTSSRSSTAATEDLSTPSGLLEAPPGTHDATIAAAAEVVRGRLARMGVTDATVTATPAGVDVRSSADAYQLHAAAQHHATTIAPITSTTLGPCNGAGMVSAGAATRCYTLGPTLTGTSAMTDAVVQATPGAGWRLTFSIDPDQYQPFRAALARGGSDPVAVVADDTVVFAVVPGVPAQESAIGPPLAEDQARQAAAALAIDSDLPVRLERPALPTRPGARVNADFWTAALGAHICGTWLDNAPAYGGDTGVHSHGDGLIYIHPFNEDEAGDNATLGLFLERGGWQASADQLTLWDGVEHRTGATCPNGQPAQVRWWVDDVEQHGDPSTYTPRDGQVIVLSFDTEPTPPGPPPQMGALYLPSLAAAT
jgi:hypothetical protein